MISWKSIISIYSIGSLNLLKLLSKGWIAVIERSCDEIEILVENANLFLGKIKKVGQIHWLECYGELQLQFNDLMIWILIADDSLISACYDQLLEIYLPFHECLLSLNLKISIYKDVKDSDVCHWFDFANTQSFLNRVIDYQPLSENSYGYLEKTNFLFSNIT